MLLALMHPGVLVSVPPTCQLLHPHFWVSVLLQPTEESLLPQMYPLWSPQPWQSLRFSALEDQAGGQQEQVSSCLDRLPVGPRAILEDSRRMTHTVENRCSRG